VPPGSGVAELDAQGAGGQQAQVVQAAPGGALVPGHLRGLSETVRAGDLLQFVSRPQEAVAALQQLQQAYVNYYTSASWAIPPRRLFCSRLLPGQERVGGVTSFRWSI
jgi:hypothetical protein